MTDDKQIRIELDKHCEHLEHELKGLRTGRASTALVDTLQVEAYGAITHLLQLASLSVPDAKTILITPWDKSILKDIEKAISHAGLGVNPLNDGAGIRLILPVMTEENRKNLLKLAGQKVEHAKIAIRTVRDSFKDEIVRDEREKKITEDDRFDALKKLDERTKEATEKATAIGAAKEKEIMTI